MSYEVPITQREDNKFYDHVEDDDGSQLGESGSLHHTKMRALRYHGNKDLRIDEITEPKCQPGFVKIKIAWCGICGSDIGEYATGPRIWGLKKHVLTEDGEIPCCMGHEISGEVAGFASDVTDLKIGQHIVVDPLIKCGKSYSSKAGVANLCVCRGFHGFSGWGGGLSEFFPCKRKSVIPISDDDLLDVAALVEPLAIGWNAVSLTDVDPGQTAFITGAGPIGLAVLLSLKARDAEVKVFVSAPKSLLSALATAYGAEAVFDPREVDVVEAVKAATGGNDVHISYEYAEMGSALPVAVESLRSGVTVVNTSVYFKVDPCSRDEASSTKAQRNTILIALRKTNVESGEDDYNLALEDAEDKGFEAVLSRVPGTVKVIVWPILQI